MTLPSPEQIEALARPLIEAARAGKLTAEMLGGLVERRGHWDDRTVNLNTSYRVRSRLMRERGAHWISTDLNPRPNSVDVHRLDAVEAVRALNPDIVFAGWIPYESTLDYELAVLGHPCIFVGEGYMGCTGSEKFWERSGKDGYRVINAGIQPDVPQWIGIHDYTLLTAPEPGFTPATSA